MTEGGKPRFRQPRVGTGIPGLDRLLCGGLLQGSTYVLKGATGTGKTVLASHIAFQHARAGGQVVFVTMLGEAHGKLIENVSDFDFFDAQLIGERIVFFSGYSVAAEGGLEALLAMLRGGLIERRPSLLVIDSMANLRFFAPSEVGYELFLRRLSTAARFVGCTLLHVSSDPSIAEAHVQAEIALADGVIQLCRTSAGMRSVREIEVLKSRGSNLLEGRHFFNITQQGISVFPRLEGTLTRSPCVPKTRTRQRFDIPNLDVMIGGGVLDCTVTGLLGPPGSGKTLLGLHFLAAGARRGEPSLYFGLFEPPERLLTKAASVGLPLEPYVKEGTLHMMWQPASEHLDDELGERLLDAVRRTGARRVFFDGIDGIRQSAVYPERLPRFLAALAHLLQCEGVTTVFSEEVGASGPVLPQHPSSGAFENLLLVRYVELRSQLYRLISVLKMPESEYDSSIREFRIGRHGVEVAMTRDSAEWILGGRAPGPRGAHP